MRKDRLSIQVARTRASLDRVEIVLSAHESGTVIVSHHDSMGAADHHRSIVITNDRAPMMDDAGGNPFDGRHGKVGG